MPKKLSAELWRARVRLFAALAGATDAVTGALLLAKPGFVLHLMRIDMPAGAAPFLRFVGAFVCGVGLSYFPPLLRAGVAQCDAALRSVFVTTGLIRLSVGLFTGVAVVMGLLPWQWISVTFSDLALASLQALIVRSGVLDGAS